ncbi:hypothetical protein QQP08_002361 [Theobroma cacao]|nr:hypothetical protein QQP08_002361 [Theobroma cacao]
MGLDIEKWEADDDSEWPPPHLLAEEEEEEEPERVAKRGFQVTGTSSLTHSSEDFDCDSDDINASKGATLECSCGRVSQGRALVERIIHCLRSTKRMVRYIIGY